MAITNGQVADADEILNALAHLFHNQAQLIYSDAITESTLLNTDYSVFTTDTMTETGMSYSADSDFYFGPTGQDSGDLTAIDEFADASIDTTIWTTSSVAPPSGNASVSEASGVLNFSVNNCPNGQSGSATCGLNGSGTKALTDYNNNVRIQWSNLSKTGTGSGPITAYIKVNATTVLSHTTQGATTYTFDIIKIGSYIYYRLGAAGFTRMAAVDAADTFSMVLNVSCTSNVYNTVDWDIDWVRTENFSTSPVASIVSLVNTSASTITNTSMTWNGGTTGGGTLTASISANNGVNFETITKNTIHRFTNTGTQLFVKFDWAADTTSHFTSPTAYAVMYNYYS